MLILIAIWFAHRQGPEFECRTFHMPSIQLRPIEILTEEEAPVADCQFHQHSLTPRSSNLPEWLCANGLRAPATP